MTHDTSLSANNTKSFGTSQQLNVAYSFNELSRAFSAASPCAT